MRIEAIDIDKITIKKKKKLERGPMLTAIVESIEKFGIINPIVVREIGTDSYELMDGWHRLTIAKELGLKKIPCQIVEISDEMLTRMMLESSPRCAVRPAEYKLLLERYLKNNPAMTLDELAKKLGKSCKYLQRILDDVPEPIIVDCNG